MSWSRNLSCQCAPLLPLGRKTEGKRKGEEDEFCDVRKVLLLVVRGGKSLEKDAAFNLRQSNVITYEQSFSEDQFT